MGGMARLTSRTLHATLSILLGRPGLTNRTRGQKRLNSGGYDFGGYVPGHDYTPRKPPVWKSVLAVIVILGMVGFYALLI